MIWPAFGNPERFPGGDTPAMIVLPMFPDDHQTTRSEASSQGLGEGMPCNH
jgi:hypothetical protein